MGATGRATAQLARALDTQVVGYDPYISADHPAITDAQIHMVGLGELLARAQILSLHLPVTQATHGLVDASILERMRTDALLINLSRGEIVDEEALANALESGSIAGAALDVRTQEPPVPGRLERLDQVIQTPHVAGLTI